jgi:hypothetical protein
MTNAINNTEKRIVLAGAEVMGFLSIWRTLEMRGVKSENAG